MEEQHAKARYHEILGDHDESEDNTRRVRERVEKYKKLRAILWSYGEIPLKDYIDALMSLYNDIGVE